VKIYFLGAADTVTGSRHLVEADGKRVLLDCGLFQGVKTWRERNWAPLPVPAASIDAVVLSHAHLDHSGFLPALVKQGFKGPVHCSPATRDLAEVLLLDSAHLQEEDARRANRGGYSRHAPALPLYSVADAKRAIARFVPIPPGRSARIGTLQVALTPVGHLLGACAVTLRCGAGTLVFSGDLGRSGDLLMPPPQTIEQADVLLVESTYGNRRHPPEDVMAELGAIVRTTARRGGSVLLPSFAVGRAQALLLVLQRLKAAGEIPAELPVFLDSPMAIDATAAFVRHPEDHSLALDALRDDSPLTVRRVRMTRSAEESKAINDEDGSIVIIAGSGMATGGRVLHHLQRGLPDPRNTVLLVGYQAVGTRGRSLHDGAPTVRMYGQDVPVRAHVASIDGLSAHADRSDLLRWLDGFEVPPAATWVVHGEPPAAAALAAAIAQRPGWRVAVAEDGATVGLDPVAVPRGPVTAAGAVTGR
jgi:metallo-beta-lactamase family protein